MSHQIKHESSYNEKAVYLLVLLAPRFCNRAGAQDSPIFPKGEIGTNTDNYIGTHLAEHIEQSR